MTDHNSDDKKTRTITLTNRPPVEIDEDAWPVIASGSWWDSKIERDWNRRYSLKVRQHSDGRTIVYGTYQTRWEGERDARAGRLLQRADLLAGVEDIVDAIRGVAADLGAPDVLVRETIADLPAERI